MPLSIVVQRLLPLLDRRLDVDSAYHQARGKGCGNNLLTAVVALLRAVSSSQGLPVWSYPTSTQPGAWFSIFVEITTAFGAKILVDTS